MVERVPLFDSLTKEPKDIRQEMRKKIEQQKKLGVISISEVKLPLKSRDELGHKILVTSDPWGFIVDHVVVEKQADVSLAIPLADRLLSRYGEGTGAVRKDEKSRLSKQKIPRKTICREEGTPRQG